MKERDKDGYVNSAMPSAIGFYKLPPSPSVLLALQGLGFALSELQFLLQMGAIYVDGRRLLQDQGVAQIATVRVHWKPRRYSINCIWDERVIAVEQDWLVVNKPRGLSVHATVDNLHENLISQLQIHRQERLFVTHRLDQDTCGLVLVARTRQGQQQIFQWLERKQIVRRYRALIDRPVTPGVYVHYMKRSKRAPREVNADPQGLRCELEVHELCPWNGRFIADIELKTGRTHQIRAQLQALGAPICGDALYGSTYPEPLGLQAYGLRLLTCQKQYQLPWPSK